VNGKAAGNVGTNLEIQRTIFAGETAVADLIAAAAASLKTDNSNEYYVAALDHQNTYLITGLASDTNNGYFDSIVLLQGVDIDDFVAANVA
jgi:hypothetical protein